MVATFKAQMTKLTNKTIDGVSAKTVGKGVAAGVVDSAAQQTVKEADKRSGASDAVANLKPATCLPANPHC